MVGGIKADFAPSTNPGVGPQPEPTPNPIAFPALRQSVFFSGVGSTSMASEHYRAVGSAGSFSQGISENAVYRMLGPSLAVETSISASLSGWIP